MDNKDSNSISDLKFDPVYENARPVGTDEALEILMGVRKEAEENNMPVSQSITRCSAWLERLMTVDDYKTIRAYVSRPISHPATCLSPMTPLSPVRTPHASTRWRWPSY